MSFQVAGHEGLIRNIDWYIKSQKRKSGYWLAGMTISEPGQVHYPSVKGFFAERIFINFNWFLKLLQNFDWTHAKDCFKQAEQGDL